MANQDLVNNMMTHIDNLLATPLEQLIRNQEKWGPIHFEPARQDIGMILTLGGYLRELPLNLLPDGSANAIAQSLNTSNVALSSIRAFSVESGSPPQQRDQVIAQIHREAEQLLVQVGNWIPFLAYQKGDVQKNINALNESVGKANQILKDAAGDIEKKKGDIDGIITAAREASASAGVAVFTSNFSEQEAILRTEAIWWLKITAGLALGTVLVGFGSFFVPLPLGASNAQVLQFMTSKIIILATLLTSTVWCGRVYKATRHQAAINNHRANSIKTFQAFVKAASDDATRNAVLLETTRSIFAIAPSGYLESSDAATDTGSKVLEIIKNTGKDGH